MSRNVSSEFREAAFAPQTDEAIICLLTITHEDLTSPLRLCNNTENVISRGETYIAFPFTLVLPDESEDRPPEARLILDNVGRELMLIIRNILSAPMVMLELVSSRDYDVVEAYYTDFQMQRITYTAMSIQADLFLENLDKEPWPSGRYTPTMFRGMF